MTHSNTPAVLAVLAAIALLLVGFAIDGAPVVAF